MSKSLKHIILDLARLSCLDQHWILQQLSVQERLTFKKHQGPTLLNDAQKFKPLKPMDVKLPKDTPKACLPILCDELALKSPLYIAIVIDMGAYSWVPLFLEQYDTQGSIQSSIEQQVPDIKFSVKQAVFNEWEASISFEALLD